MAGDSYDHDIGIIGGGAAGLTVAAGAAQLGAGVLLIEKEKLLGGDCLHYGCVPSKTLIKSAKVYHLMKHAADYGLPEVDPAPVDFSKIAARIRSVIEAIQHHDSEERFCGLGAKVEFGVAEFMDEHCVRLNGKTVSAKFWVIATGSSPAAPPFPGLDQVDYLTNEQVFSLQKLPASLTILGAGPIAVEMAQAFCRLGSRVTVIQRGGQILSKEDKDMADAVQVLLESEGVCFHLNSTVGKVMTQGEEKVVEIEDQSEKTTVVKSEEILVALGRKPGVDGLGLEKIGVDVGKGIVVDNRMRTTQKHIYAAGDVTGLHQFTHAAGYEGGIVVANTVFRLPRKANYTWLPHCTYCDPELAGVGISEKTARDQGIEYTVWEETFSDNDRSRAEGEFTGKIKLILDKSENPIGVSILGLHGGELLNEWVAALNGKVKLSTLAGAIHPYPTLGEINKKVAGSVLSRKIFSPTIKKGLKLFFNLKGRACSLDDTG